jgi:Na+-driven multidrug efflux pump
MNGTPETLSNDTATLIVAVILIFTLYWSIRGPIQLFQRHNSILVIFYLVFLFPIAYCHMLLLGIFANSIGMMLNATLEGIGFARLPAFACNQDIKDGNFLR